MFLGKKELNSKEVENPEHIHTLDEDQMLVMISPDVTLACSGHGKLFLQMIRWNCMKLGNI